MEYLQVLRGGDDDDGNGEFLDVNNQRDGTIQIALSLVLGISAFVAFCILRTKWPSLYAARKRKRLAAAALPELPGTFFGWIPVLWRVTEQQVLASAGLDAYVFLRFFKMAIKCLSVLLFFALVVFKPVHDAFPEQNKKKGDEKDPHTLNSMLEIEKSKSKHVNQDYLYMYFVFAYVFTALAFYLLITETERIIGIRQEFLGSQCTVTDRTIRLSGIPPSLRSEEKVREYIERLQIGKVESVTFARKWKELDDLVERRMSILRKLEESWTIYLSHRTVGANRPTRSAQPEPIQQDAYHDQEEQDERGPLLRGNENRYWEDADRPTTRVKFGFLNLRGRRLDAIDYYEEKLRLIDEKVHELRKNEFEPMPLAFVTLDSVPACQMAIQAVLDPSPMHLIAKISPAPADVVWRNTYMPRWERMSRGWVITAAITILTVFWSIILVPVATALNLESIKELGLKSFANWLEAHPFSRSLVKTQLPTLISSLLFVVVPFLYDWLANLQGMTSQADIELSIISKNFFFLFFNYFVIFTVLGTFSNFWEFFSNLQESLKDTTRIAFLLASSLQQLSPFYTNLVILQGVGLYPFRLLQFGSVALYPIYRFWCKTPRDYAELSQPAVFSYGFYMPTVMLIFIICMVYSILRESWKLLLAGLIYFIIGGFVTKYHLLYSMHHREQSTGRSWVMICNRMMVGLLLFQLEIAGQIGLKGYFKLSVGMVPLLIATIWFSLRYTRNYVPLMTYISLGSIERRLPEGTQTPIAPDGWGEEAQVRQGLESRPDTLYFEANTRFVNPSLVTPLPGVWIKDEDGEVPESELQNQAGRQRLEGALNAAI